MDAFEAQLEQVRPVLERYIRFRLSESSDAEDLVQEVCTQAYLKYGQLREPGAFKPWILAIARNCCRDYYRKKSKMLEVSLEAVPETALIYGRQGQTLQSVVMDTMEQLAVRDQQILRMFYWEESSQAEIAQRLTIPLGTVKSRLSKARQRFREKYPYPPEGGNIMTKLPEFMPKYTIAWTQEPPFSCRCEELQGWCIVPRMGEKLSWALYEFPERRRTEYTDMEVAGRAEIHGIEGVEVAAVQYGAADYYRTGCLDKTERRFVVQLTDTHSRYLAETHVENGVRKCYTFLDGEVFLNNWGYGPDNIGNEIDIRRRGTIHRTGNTVTSVQGEESIDTVGRCTVTMGGKTYDTVCVMDISCFNDAVVSEQYLDKNGRTVLWRRFNRDDWALEYFGGVPWSQQLPHNERLLVNGHTYVHWYDCLTSYLELG